MHINILSLLFSNLLKSICIFIVLGVGFVLKGIVSSINTIQPFSKFVLLKQKLKGEVSWGFWAVVKISEIRPSLSYKIILEHRQERDQLVSWKEQLVICSGVFWKQKCENLKNVSLAVFKFQSIPTYSVSGQRH